MQPDDRTRILHMVEAAEAAIGFASGRDRRELDDDRMLLFALVHAIEVMGEAAGRVSARTRSAHANIPWALMVAMRHRLVHGYFDIDRDIVWATVSRELPALLSELRSILGQE